MICARPRAELATCTYSTRCKIKHLATTIHRPSPSTVTPPLKQTPYLKQKYKKPHPSPNTKPHFPPRVHHRMGFCRMAVSNGKPKPRTAPQPGVLSAGPKEQGEQGKKTPVYTTCQPKSRQITPNSRYVSVVSSRVSIFRRRRETPPVGLDGRRQHMSRVHMMMATSVKNETPCCNSNKKRHNKAG